MKLSYVNQVSISSLQHIINEAENAIKMKSICKQVLPDKCNQQAAKFIQQNIHNVATVINSNKNFQTKNNMIQPLKIDNRSPLKLKVQKVQRKNYQTLQQKDTSDIKSFRKSSALKSRKDQFTASTNNRNIHYFDKPLDLQFQEQTNTKGQSSRRFVRTAEVTTRKKYFQLHQQALNITQGDDEQRRTQLKRKRLSIQMQQINKNQKLSKLSYRRSSLQNQLALAKVANKGYSAGKNKEVNQIVNFQIQDGSVFTNKFKKPFRKTIENIINLQFQDTLKQRILRRKTHKQSQVKKNTKNKKQNDSQDQNQNFILKNSQFNNSGKRQISLIPYLTITAGVCLSERSIQATISRARPSEQLSRQRFFKTIQNKNFRSYSKQVSPQKGTSKKYSTIQVCQQNRASKKTLNNQTKDSLRRSILWAPKLSREVDRIKIIKQDFIQQMTSLA